MKKYKIGTCGHYDLINTIPNGQTVKTINVTNELKKHYGSENIKVISTHDWKKRPLKLFFNLISLARTSQNILIFPDYNGVQVILPILNFLKKFYKFSLYYVVIGAWLPDLLKNKKRLRKHVKSLDGLFVETNTLKEQLYLYDIKQTYVFPNFKQIKIVNENELIMNHTIPFRLCFFSRVTPQKGIIELINTIMQINIELGKPTFLLDIYGPIDKDFEKDFIKMIEDFPSEINYCGIVDPYDSVTVLKNYFLQVFPTKYKTEGFPGSILDSYCAGVPVLVSRWNSWNDIVEEGKTGLSYDFDNTLDLKNKLIYISKNPNRIIDMKTNCIEEAKKFEPKKIIKIVTDVIMMD